MDCSSSCCCCCCCCSDGCGAGKEGDSGVSTVAEEVVEALEVADGETPMGEGLDGLGMGPGGGPIGPMGPTAGANMACANAIVWCPR
eukprot:1159054-Pelagomonas_calceolata.AAC.14